MVWRIVVPLSKPAIGALAIFAFMGAWNDYIWQLIIINKEVMLIIFIAFQDYFVKGITVGGYTAKVSVA